MNSINKDIRGGLIMSGWIVLAICLTCYLPASSLVIAFLIILFFMDESPLKKVAAQFKNAYTYIFILPFLLSLAGMLNTENTASGWHFVEVSLSLFIFPFLASDFSRLNIPRKWRNVFTAFTAGLIISLLMSLARAIFRYQDIQSINVFFYVEFSKWLMSPNHLSNYVIFGIIITILELIERKQHYLPVRSVFVLIFILLILLLYIFLLASKASLLILALACLYFFIYFGRHKIMSWLLIIIIGLFTLSGALLVVSQTMLKARITNAGKAFHPSRIDYTVPESTTTRLSAFMASTDLIADYWYIGVGTGDVREELTKYYKKNQYIAAYKYGTHPHNQFLRSFLAYGFAGLLSMLLLFFMLFRQAKYHKKSIIHLWASIMLILFLTDDILYIQAGVIYFSMFSALFTFALNNDKKYDPFFTPPHG